MIRRKQWILFLGMVAIISCGKYDLERTNPFDYKSDRFNPRAADIITDFDGNNYPTVIIGTQTWMAENLRVTHFNNGAEIPTTYPAVLDLGPIEFPLFQWSYNQALIELHDALGPLVIGDFASKTLPELVGLIINQDQELVFERWIALLGIPDGSIMTVSELRTYCIELAAIIPGSFGRFYTWFTIQDGNLCPLGWRVPNDRDWSILANYLGGFDMAGEKMKTEATQFWIDPTPLRNKSLFNAMPAGFREPSGQFAGIGGEGGFWSSDNLAQRNYFFLRNENPNLNGEYRELSFGMTVRCIKE